MSNHRYCCPNMEMTMSLLDDVDALGKSLGYRLQVEKPSGWKLGESMFHWDYTSQELKLVFTVSVSLI